MSIRVWMYLQTLVTAGQGASSQQGQGLPAAPHRDGMGAAGVALPILPATGTAADVGMGQLTLRITAVSCPPRSKEWQMLWEEH